MEYVSVKSNVLKGRTILGKKYEIQLDDIKKVVFLIRTSFSNLFRKIQVNNFDIMSSFHSLKQLEGFMGNMIKESDIDFNIQRKLRR